MYNRLLLHLQIYLHSVYCSRAASLISKYEIFVSKHGARSPVNYWWWRSGPCSHWNVYWPCLGRCGDLSPDWPGRGVADTTAAYCSLHTVNCTLHTSHCTPHIAHCTLHTAHCSLHNVHCTLITNKCILSTAHFTVQNIVHFTTTHVGHLWYLFNQPGVAGAVLQLHVY